MSPLPTTPNQLYPSIEDAVATRGRVIVSVIPRFDIVGGACFDCGRHDICGAVNV